MKFTTDPYVKETLSFLMTREVAHYKMFEAALDSIQPNFPLGALQADPRFTQQYFNFSPEKSVQAPWNTGEMPDMSKEWQYIPDPQTYVKQTQGLTDNEDTYNAELEQMDKVNQQMSQMRSEEVKMAEPEGTASWSDYDTGL